MTFLVYKNDLDFPYDPALPKDEAMGKIIKGNNFRLIKFQGFQKVGDVVYTQDDEGNYKKEEK